LSDGVNTTNKIIKIAITDHIICFAKKLFSHDTHRSLFSFIVFNISDINQPIGYNNKILNNNIIQIHHNAVAIQPALTFFTSVIFIKLLLL
jgi:hypothetical protein